MTWKNSHAKEAAQIFNIDHTIFKLLLFEELAEERLLFCFYIIDV